MKNENTQKTLEAQILECKKRLKELASEIEIDEEKSKEYNKIIVQKAILVDRYKKLCFKPSLMTRFKEAIRKNPFKKKERLICDYFLS
ncbi:hypothetical protein IJ531_06620 [bacterium]|nr:hypothetical protein [bacterium]